MLGLKLVTWIKSLLLLFAVGATVELLAPADAEARAGRGRSSGRTSGYSKQQSQPSQQATPPQQAQPMAPAAGGGGLMKGLAAGVAGGFLGSMLFSSVGNAAGLGGGQGGGIGFLEIALFAGLAFFLFRWWKGRQQQHAYATAGRSEGIGGGVMARSAGATFPAGTFGAFEARGIDPEAAEDLFFRVQGAWTRRDVTSVRTLLGPELLAALERDLGDLRKDGQINRLENIAVRATEVLRSWIEAGQEHSTVRITASLLDYTVDEHTGRVVAGSDAEPVRFEEDWTFAKAESGGPWTVVGIEQT